MAAFSPTSRRKGVRFAFSTQRGTHSVGIIAPGISPSMRIIARSVPEISLDD